MSNAQQIFLLLVFFLFQDYLCLAQAFERLQIPIILESGDTARNLAGGLALPQFSSVDLDFDGVEDLYVFDDGGNVHLPFLNRDNEFVFAPEYQSVFPDISSWALLRDYNGDGIKDIFAYAFRDPPVGSWLKVYQGYRDGDRIGFRRLQLRSDGLNVVHAQLDSSGSVPLHVNSFEYPDLSDVDCDGDLDLLSFRGQDFTVSLFANQSVEMGYGLDSLIFVLRDPCYGGFAVNDETMTLDLAMEPGTCVENTDPGRRSFTNYHCSTLLSLDLNGDDAQELVFGTKDMDSLFQLNNGGSCEMAWMDKKGLMLSADPVPEEVTRCPTVFHLDLNNDGKGDLVMAPFHSQWKVGRQSFWHYENTGDDLLPKFELVRKDFLEHTMLDLGVACMPSFFDYNGDDLPDLLLGNYQNSDERASLHLLQNVGTKTTPMYQVIDSDYLGLRAWGESRWVPAVGDMDGDGDEDLILGNGSGDITYFENRGGKGNVAEFGFPVRKFFGLSANFPSPSIIDVDKDGLNDLLIADHNGPIRYYRNQGTVTNPGFGSLPDDYFFGLFVRHPLGQERIPIPRLSLMESAELGRTIVAGTSWGGFYHHRLDGFADEILPRIEDDGFETIWEGGTVSADFADIDGDFLLEAVVGNGRGGIAIYKTNYHVKDYISGTVSSAEQAGIRVLPNPSSGVFNLAVPFREWNLVVYDAVGKVVLKQAASDTNIQIDLGDRPAGIYWYLIHTTSGQWSGKLLLR